MVTAYPAVSANTIILFGQWWDHLTRQGEDALIRAVPRQATTTGASTATAASRTERTPNVRSSVDEADIKLRPWVTRPVRDTALWAFPLLSNNDTQFGPFGGWDITAGDEPTVLVELLENSAEITLDQPMLDALAAAYSETGATPLDLEVGDHIQAVWIGHAAVLTTPAPQPTTGFLSAAATTSLVASYTWRHRGPWSAITAYDRRDVVSYGGSSWIADAPNTNITPSDTAPAWRLVVAKGDKGDRGEKGTTGDKGADSTAKGEKGDQGPVGPAGPLRSPIQRFYDAVAARRRGPVDILCVGDSLTEGTGASARTTRWIDRLIDHLRVAYPTPNIRGGAGYIPAATSSDYPSGWTYGGNVAANGTFGLGRRSVVLRGADGYAERTVLATSVTVAWTFTPGGGTFEVVVDGTVAATISTASSDSATHGGGRRAVPFTRGTHTVRLRWKSGGDAYFAGLFVFDGDETRGVRIIDSGQHGSSTADWSRLVNPGTAYLLGDEVAALSPALLVLGLCPNDMIQGLTPASAKANLLDIIALARANAAVVDGRPLPVVLHAAYQFSADYTYPWSSYVTAMREIARDGVDIVLVDFSARLPRASANPDAMLAADGIHLNDTGYGFYAAAFREVLAPDHLPRSDHAPRARPVRRYTAGMTARPDEVLEVDATNGAVVLEPWVDLRVGERITVIKIDPSTNPVSMNAAFAIAGDGVITTQWRGFDVAWDGTRFVSPGQGAKGDKGDKGDAGASVKGDKGDPGTAGTNGTNGAAGPPGTAPGATALTIASGATTPDASSNKGHHRGSTAANLAVAKANGSVDTQRLVFEITNTATSAITVTLAADYDLGGSGYTSRAFSISAGKTALFVVYNLSGVLRLLSADLGG